MFLISSHVHIWLRIFYLLHLLYVGGLEHALVGLSLCKSWYKMPGPILARLFVYLPLSIFITSMGPVIRSGPTVISRVGRWTKQWFQIANSSRADKFTI